MEEELVLATTGLAASGDELDYVHVDWGPDFTRHHDVSFPDVTPVVFANLGPLALGYVLSAGGSGYFRMEAVQHHVEAGRLHLVSGAPRFSYPVYIVYSANADEGVLAPALAGLRALTAAKGTD
jgi:hypothetical protein